MKKTFISVLLALAASVGTIFAETIERVQIGELYYNLLTENATATVTHQNASEPYWSTIITTANIPENIEYNSITYRVTAIGAGAFYGCSSLVDVTIPNSVTCIYGSAFRGCSSLISLSIPNSVTYMVGDFTGCNSLSAPVYNAHIFAFLPFSYSGAYKIPEGIQSIDGCAFHGCTGLTSIEIPSSTINIGDGTFKGCTGLTTMIVDANNTVYDSRNNCNAIIKTATNTLIAGCKNSNIPNTVMSIGNWAFCGCNGLTSITIPDGVTSIGDYAFMDCSGLKSIKISEGVRSLGKYAFANCTGLTSIAIPNTVVTIGEDAFSGCNGLTSINIPNGVTIIEERTFKGCSALTSVTIPNTITSVGKFAFVNCASLASVTIPNSVTNLGLGVFENCQKLVSVTINGNIASIEGQTFNDCSNLTSVTIPNSVTSIGSSAFSGCYSLTNIDIPNSVTSIGRAAFYGCTKMSALTIGDGVKSIGDYAFYSCYGLSTVKFGNSVEQINYAAFANCTKLGPVIFPNSLKSIGYAAFYNTRIASDVVIPEGVTSIGEYAFEECDLTSITIPNTITYLPTEAFYHCASLNEVTLPETITSIGDSAFVNCNQLTVFTCHATTPPICGVGIFEGVDKSIPLYVPAESVEAYKAADQWKDFTNIQAIPAPELEDGIYIIGEATGYNSIETKGVDKCLMTACANVVTSTIREGLFEKYIVLDAGKDFSIIKKSGDTFTTYTASLAQKSIATDGDAIPNGYVGTIAEGSQAMQINTRGLYHVIIDFNINNDISSARILIVPVSWSVRGDMNGWGCTAGSLTETGNVLTWTWTDIPLKAGNQYKYSYGQCGWKIMEIDNGEVVSISTNTGLPSPMWDGEDNLHIDVSGVYTLSLSYRLTAGAIGLSFSHTAIKTSDIPIPDYSNCELELVGNAIAEQVGATTDNIWGWGNVFSLGKPSKQGHEYTWMASNVLLSASGEFRIRTVNWASSGGIDAFDISGNNANGNFSVPSNGLYDIIFTRNAEYEYDKPVIIRPHSCGTGLDWTFDETTGTLTITGSGAMTDFATIDDVPWASHVAAITSIVLPDGLTSIGKYAFYRCTGLTSVTIPNSVISIGYSAFGWCTSLTAFDVESSNPNYSDRDGVLYNKDQTVLIQYPINKKEKEFTIPNPVDSIGSWAFYGCVNLTKVNIPNSVTRIGDFAFIGCSSLTSLTIPNSVTLIGIYAFSDCTGLTSITIPNSVTWIGLSAFRQCANLNTITCHAATPPSCGDDVFNEVDKSTCALYVPAESIDAYKAADQWKDFTNIQAIFGTEPCLIASGACGDNLTWELSCDSVLTISGKGTMWDYCHDHAPWLEKLSYIKNVVIENGVTTIGGCAFAQGTNIVSVHIPSSITEFGQTPFYGCSNISALYITDLAAWCNSINEIGSGFWNGYDLFINELLVTILNIPDGIQTIKDGAFENCVSLQSVTIPYGVTNIGSHAFAGCDQLNIVQLPTGVTTIGNGAFRDCSSLTSINIPSGVTIIENYTFSGCSQLTSIKLPEHTTAIGEGAFADCIVLKSIEIPNSVKSIGDYAFAACSGLTSIVNHAPEPQPITSETFAMVDKSTCTLYVPAESIEIYQAADGWKEFSILSIEEHPLPTTYTITFVNDDGQVLDRREWEENATPFCEEPTKTDGEYIYCFTGWSPEIAKVTETATYQATYEVCGGWLSDKVYWKLQGDTLLVEGLGVIPDYETAGRAPWTNFNAQVNVISVAKVSRIGENAFANMSANIIHLSSNVTTIGRNAFEGCTAVQKVDYAGTPCEWAEINFVNEYANPLCYGASLYAKKTLVTNACIPVRDTISLSPFIGMTAVHYQGTLEQWCSSTFTDDYIPDFDLYIDGVLVENPCLGEGLTKISAYAFTGCKSLKSICIPASMQQIGADAFKRTPNLEKVLYAGSVKQWCSITFANAEANPTYHASQFYIDSVLLGDRLEIPNSITTIHAFAFPNTAKLDVYFHGTDPSDYFLNSFGEPLEVGSKHFYVPCGTKAEYQKQLNYAEDLFTEYYHLNYEVSSVNDSMGIAEILHAPTCEEPELLIQATPKEGYYFAMWSDSVTANLRSIVLTQDTLLEAIFGPCLSYNINMHEVICQGDTFEFNGLACTSDTIAKWFGKDIHGCDSVVTLYLTVNRPTDMPLEQATICGGDYYEWHGRQLDKAGLYRDTLRYIESGCDSIRFTLQLNVDTVADENKHFEEKTVFVGQELEWQGQTYTLTQDTVLRISYVNANGCDSAVYTCQVTVLPIPTYTVVVKTENDSLGTVIGGGSYKQGEAVTLTAIPNEGYYFSHWSDSIITNPRTIIISYDAILTAVFMPCHQYNMDMHEVICQGDTFKFHDLACTSDTIAKWYGKDIHGCDSIVTLYLTVNKPTDMPVERATICGGDYYEWRGRQLDKAGLYYDTVRYLESGCDSIRYTLQLRVDTVADEDRHLEKIEVYEGQELEWRGRIYIITQDTVLRKVYRYESGCDSAIYTCHVTALPVVKTFTVVVTSDNDLYGLVQGGGTYKQGEQVTLTATPNEGYVFAKWSNDITANPYQFIVTEDVKLVAFFQKKQAEEAEVVQPEAHPTDISVIISWPTIDNAVVYTIEIKKNGELICTLSFNAMGQLIGIAFAPSRDGNRDSQSRTATQTSTGWQYTVNGLEPNTTYTYSVTAKKEDDSVAYENTVEFTTEAPQAIDEISGRQSDGNSQKILHKGQLLILHNGDTFNAQGARVK